MTNPPSKEPTRESRQEEPDSGHTPILVPEITQFLLENGPTTLLDCTVGRGGHAAQLLAASAELRLIGLDVDADNLAFAADRLAPFGDRVTLRRADFASCDAELAAVGMPRVDAILADLGVSSNQIADPVRGLSFLADGPLDMRLDARLKTTAADLVNSLPEGQLADMLWQNAEERRSRKIARRLCQARRQGRINSTVLLARLVASALGENPDSHRSKIHPATRTFMALRMAVNGELDSLRSLLAAAPGLLGPGGRIAIISFHSGEDRIVKGQFRVEAKAGTYRILTKKPIVSGEDERVANPRSRSAKLRVAEKTANA